MESETASKGSNVDGMSLQAYTTYRKVQVETAPPHKLIGMLLHAAATRCEKAQEALEQGLADEARPLVRKAQDIVSELMAALDYNHGGPIANRLFLLYDFVHGRLTEANLRRDATAAGEAKQVLRRLADIWNSLEPAGGDSPPSAAQGQMAGTLDPDWRTPTEWRYGPYQGVSPDKTPVPR